MTIVDFITNNPDLVTVVVGAVTGLIWKRGKGIKMDDLWETLLQVGRQAFPHLLRSAKLYDDAHVREVISKTIWAGLTRLGVPKNEAVMKLVDEAVEHVVGELAQKVLEYHFGQLKTVAIPALEGALDKLKSAPQDAPIVPAPDGPAHPEPGRVP